MTGKKFPAILDTAIALKLRLEKVADDATCVSEVDIDRLPSDKEVFTKAPQIEDGHLVVPNDPGVGHRAQRRRNPRP